MNHLKNKTIRIKNTEDYDFDPDVGMLFNVIDVKVHHPNTEHEHFELVLDFTEYEEYNIKFMLPTYYDNIGNPTLTWKETNFYPNNKKVTIFLNSFDEGVVFEVVEDGDNPLYKDKVFQVYREMLDDLCTEPNIGHHLKLELEKRLSLIRK